MQKALIVAGDLLVIAGIFWPAIVKLPLGRLPGDIIINKPGLKIYIPVTTMILISVIVSAILWWFRK